MKKEELIKNLINWVYSGLSATLMIVQIVYFKEMTKQLKANNKQNKIHVLKEE